MSALILTDAELCEFSVKRTAMRTHQQRQALPGLIYAADRQVGGLDTEVPLTERVHQIVDFDTPVSHFSNVYCTSEEDCELLASCYTCNQAACNSFEHTEPSHKKPFPHQRLAHDLWQEAMDAIEREGWFWFGVPVDARIEWSWRSCTGSRMTALRDNGAWLCSFESFLCSFDYCKNYQGDHARMHTTPRKCWYQTLCEQIVSANRQVEYCEPRRDAIRERIAATFEPRR